MNDILIGSDKLLPTRNSMMEDSPGGIALNLSPNMTPVNIMLAQNMTTKGPHVPALNPVSKSINVQSNIQQPATVTTVITRPIMSQVPHGVSSNPIQQTMDTGNRNSFMRSEQPHAQGSKGYDIRGVYHIPDVGAVNGRTTVKVSSQPRCLENRHYGSPGVLHCENQQDMVPGYWSAK